MDDTDYGLFCDYPVYDVSTRRTKTGGTIRFRVGGGERGECRLRLVQKHGDAAPITFSVHTRDPHNHRKRRAAGRPLRHRWQRIV